MKISTKTMLLLGTVVTALFLVLYLLSTQVVHRGFLQLEETYTQRNVRRVLNIFDFLPGELMTTVQDWAMWDDTYRFAQDGNAEYVEGNLDTGTYETLKIDLFLITNASGEVVWGHGFDREISALTPIPDDLLAIARTGLPSSRVRAEYGGAAGIVLLKDGPALIAMNPILKSDREGPAQGTLVMVKRLDQKGAAQMEKNLQLDLSVFRADAVPNTPLMRDILTGLTSGNDVEIRRINKNTVAGFGLVRDLFGKPALLVEIGMPRDIYHQSMQTTTLLMTVLALSVITFSIAIMVLLRRQVLSRIEKLSRGVGRFSHGDTPEAISLNGHDELSTLATEINQALERETMAREALRESEDRVRAKLNAILLPEGDISALELGDVIDIPAMQTIMDDMHSLLGISASAIIDAGGNILVASNWQRICTDFHRANPLSCTNCVESDTLLTSGVEAGKYKIYRCKNNLWTASTPIHVAGRHIGSIFFGQFIYDDSEVDREVFRTQARLYGYDEEQYMAALDKVPRLDRETVERVMKFYSRFGALISTLGYGNIKLARILEERQRIEEKLLVNEASLRLANAQLRRAQRIARIGSWTYEPGAHRASWTEEMFRIFGIDPKGKAPMHDELRQLIHPDQRDEYDEAVRVGREDMKPVSLDLRVVRPDGTERIVHHQWEPIPNESGAGFHYLGTTQDITERKQAEEALAQRAAELEMATHVAEKNASELASALAEVKAAERERRALEEQLHQSQKMESLGILAGGIAHDFNNILHGIMGYTSLMRSEVDGKSDLYGYVDHVETAVKRAGELTQQLLSFARKGKYDIVSMDVVPVIDEVVDFLRRGFRKGVKVETEYSEGIGAVSGDKSQIHQAVMNLCINAAQAMPSGGTLTIKAENVSITSDDNLGIEDAQPGEYVLLTFRDTGVGMSEETLSRIFEPFFTTKGPGGGTGLGLSMVFGVAKNHGGAVDVTSKPGKGTTFRLLLPREVVKHDAEPQSPQIGTPEPVTSTPDASRKPDDSHAVLVVDDEEVILALASKMLRKLGWPALNARNGMEAVRTYREKGAGIDVVLLDMRMPGMGGLETFRELKKIDPSVRVIVSSGYDKDENTQQVLKEGAVSLLRKPYLMGALAEEISRALDLAGTSTEGA